MKLFQGNFSPLLKMALPLALTGLLQSGVFFFETFFLAHLSTDILAAGALVSWLFGTFAVIIFGVLGSINVLIAHKYGANDHQGISLVVHDGFWLALFLVIPSFILFWNMSPIFILLGQSPVVAKLAESYLHALTWGLLPNFIMIVLLEVIIGLGHTHLILKFTLLSVLLNVSFSFVLIFGKFGFPSLGIAGAGWGITISCWITTFVLSIYLFFNKRYRGYFNLLFTTSKPSYLLEMLRIGAPMGFMYCVEVAFFFALTLLMGIFGSQLMAANQVALQYLGTLMSVIFSIAQAITVRMGHLLGSGDKNSASQTAYAGIILSFLFMFFVALIYWFFPNVLISIDFDIHKPENSQIVFFATQFLLVSAIFQIVEAMRISLFGALRGMKDTRFTLLISIISFWIIALPVGYFLATSLKLGGTGLWWGMVLGAVSSLMLLYWRLQFKLGQYNISSLNLP
ncbi:MATE family efflux transporter [Legionella cardiaca]|uniref:Multidrug-efflux transporter n=1 Tax=Legionella cardiaca TaxID=1071983 RepID=A0ABY8AV45_9GAMM|nr:MATE family efflux transporter [Legionella cardiaca]WED44309.1 MATE family efflux transporter [Legionella cardiaca]